MNALDRTRTLRILTTGLLAALCCAAFPLAASADEFPGESVEVPSGVSPDGGGEGNPYPSVITVSKPGVVTDLSVTLTGFGHETPDDVDLLLVGPTGVKVLLMSDVGGTTDANGLTATRTHMAHACSRLQTT